LTVLDTILRRFAPGEGWAVLRRFPLPSACALAATVVAIATDEDIPFVADDEVGRFLALLLLSLIAAFAVAMWAEARGATWRRHLPFAFAVAGLLAARLYSTPFENSLAALMLAPIVVLAAATLPFIGRPGSSDAFWAYNRGAWLAGLFGGFVAVVLGLGLTLAYSAIERLLDIGIDGDVYEHTWTVCLGLVWPLVSLGNAPRICETLDRAQAGRLVNVLVTYVLTPVVGLYLTILLLYVARIAILWALPSGEAAPIIWGCAAIAVITHVLAYPMRETGRGAVRLYHRHLFRVLMVPVIVLAIAVWVRIDAYGMTEQRYVLALGTAALLVHCVLGMVWPARRLVIAPAALGALLILGSFGPWGAIAASERSQVAILKNLLERNGLLTEGRVVPATTQPAPVDSQRIGSVIAYLVESGKVDAIAGWFPEGSFGGDEFPTWTEALKALNIGYVAAWANPGDVNFWSVQDAPLEITGFDLAVPFSLNSGTETSVPWPGAEPPGSIGLSVRGWLVSVAWRTETVVLDIATTVEEARRTMNADGAPRPLIVEGSSGILRARLVLHSLNAATRNGVLTPSWGQGTLLIGASAP
jgi:hypothetical protein